jgi:hypothetical protein
MHRRPNAIVFVEVSGIVVCILRVTAETFGKHGNVPRY